MNHRSGIACCAALAAAACAPSSAQTESPEAGLRSWADALGAEITDEWSAPEYRAFDFWIGEGDANWRPRPQGEFYHKAEGNRMRHRVFPILGGKAVVELAWPRDNPEEPSQRGFSVRYYDPARERWVMAQHWPNADQEGEAFLDQLIGAEHLGRLTMYSIVETPKEDGTLDTQHRRYNFTDVRAETFRWDGSNTKDRGDTWYTWYVVDFYRLRDIDPFKAAGTSWPGVYEEALCTKEPHGAFDGLQGVWEGTATDANGRETSARLTAGKVLDGCGVAAVLESGGERVFWAIGYSSRFERWAAYRLDDRPGTTHAYFVSQNAGPGAVFEEAEALAIKDEFTPYARPRSFDTAGAQRRVAWETVNDTEIAFREEIRASTGDDWRVDVAYRLHRVR